MNEPPGDYNDELLTSRLNEEKYRLLWDGAGDAFILFDRDNTILETNAAVREIFGYDVGELLGRNMSVLQPERFRDAHRAGVERYLASGEKHIDWRAAEVIGLHRDGHEIPVEIAFNHINLNGRDLFAGFIRDISQRKRTELAAARLAAIVDSSHDAVISKTLKGIITSWNAGAQRLFGYTSDEIVGRSIRILIPNEHQEEEDFILATLARGEVLDHFETVRQRKDGSEVNVSITASPIRDPEGKVVGVSKIARDITERKMAEKEREELLGREQSARAEAENANRLKDEFLSSVSHELRTPLTAILGWSHILQQGLDPENTRAALESIERNARSQMKLIGDLLDISRIVSGKLRLEVAPLETDVLIQAAVDVVRPAADAKNIQLEVVLGSDAGPISGDFDRLQQVVWNLLTNSVKFTPKGGKIQVRLERVNSHVEIAVTDNGQGIDPVALPYIFDRFRQADQTSTRQHGGLGLGLSIARQLVELHGGTIAAHSPGVNQGATFIVKLPIMAAHGAAGRRQGEAPPGFADKTVCPPELRNLRVLVVDDENDSRHLLCTLLTRCHAETESASSVAEAMEVFARFRPHVVVSDIGMPHQDGYALIAQIRELPPEQGGRVPAVALTAFARTEDRVRALTSGFQAHLPKPVEPTEFLAVIASLAERVG